MKMNLDWWLLTAATVIAGIMYYKQIIVKNQRNKQAKNCLPPDYHNYYMAMFVKVRSVTEQNHDELMNELKRFYDTFKKTDKRPLLDKDMEYLFDEIDARLNVFSGVAI